MIIAKKAFFHQHVLSLLWHGTLALLICVVGFVPVQFLFAGI